MKLYRKFSAVSFAILLILLLGGMTVVNAQFGTEELERDMWRLNQRMNVLYNQYQEMLAEDAAEDELGEIEDEIFALREEAYELRTELREDRQEEFYQEYEEEEFRDDYRGRRDATDDFGPQSRRGGRGFDSQGQRGHGFAPGGFTGAVPDSVMPFFSGPGRGHHCW